MQYLPEDFFTDKQLKTSLTDFTLSIENAKYELKYTDYILEF